MSLRKFMHPKNKYKKVPDFKLLALLYPEFRNVANIDLTGKVKIDFKNEDCLRVLTEVLLKHDFNLEVKIPPKKLIPTLPLRLNYILWIEDLMKHSSFNDMEEVVGIDIGTGSVSIYPLLFAKMYGNQMIGTEVDETSIQTAIQQIENNKLQHLIKKEDSEKVQKRLPPRNAPTGNNNELTVQGGERLFVMQMINESIEIKEKVKVYTTMFGRRSNLLFLLKFLKRKNIENATWTEFCQGHTKRWGLAWTFLPKDVIDLTNAPVIRKSGDYIAKLLREKRPTELQFPMQHKFSSFDNAINFLEETLEELNVQIKELNLPIDDFNGWSCQLVAENDTWSYARRKRRLAQRQLDQFKDHDSENRSTSNHTEHLSEKLIENNSKDTIEQKTIPPSKEKSVAREPLLICSFFVELIEQEESENDDIKISMIFEKGTGGKNALETFKQYLINKLNLREYFQKQSARPNKKKRKRLKSNTSNKCETDVSSQEDEKSFENSVESV
ncbi:uncharacterized protein LOC100882516 isoform X2 [Megachile rotundata]|uniref:uncharacterized protein LOC100882516 isoform X2 n=1 Tax=Megachile rotundata TaxID=143995 RepID=UPI003FD13EB4